MKLYLVCYALYLVFRFLNKPVTLLECLLKLLVVSFKPIILAKSFTTEGNTNIKQGFFEVFNILYPSTIFSCQSSLVAKLSFDTLLNF
jgi:hypothetical protein